MLPEKYGRVYMVLGRLTGHLGTINSVSVMARARVLNQSGSTSNSKTKTNFFLLALIEHQLDLAYEKSLDQNKLMQAPSPVFFTESEAPFRGKLGQKIRQNKKTEQGFLSLKFQLEVIPKALSACYAEFRVKNLGLVQKLRDFHQVN